jgi:hypothetical protein
MPGKGLPAAEAVDRDGAARRVAPVRVDVAWRGEQATVTVDLGPWGTLALSLPRAEALRVGRALRGAR